MAAVATRPKASTRNARNARALERARSAPVAPRRKSGPAPRPRTVRKPVAAPTPRVARIAQGSAALLLDRLLRGRAWIALVGVLLAGIVFLNVSVLELNRGIAQTDAQSAALERTNSTLREKVATLSSTERIQQLAEQRGYVLPQPGDVTYLHGSPSAARLAAQRIQPPSQSSQLTVGSPQSAVPPAPASTTTPTSPSLPTAALPTANSTSAPTTTTAP